jgi:transcriptional regulator with XRE-family HTH domain
VATIDDELATQKRLGQWVRVQRLRAKLTQKQLSEQLDVSYQMLQKMEKGHARITVQRLNQLAGVLGIKAGDLMNDFAALLVGAEPASLIEGQRLSSEEQKLLTDFNRIHDKSMRRVIMELVEKSASR